MSRRNFYTGKYALDKNEFLHAKYYALRYTKWKDEYQALEDSSKAIRYDMEKVQASGDFDPVEAAGMRRAELAKKMETIERTAEETDPELAEWILQGVTQYFATFKYLSTVKRIPCGKDKYYHTRRKFYYLLSQKI